MRRIFLLALGTVAAATTWAFDPITDGSDVYVVTWPRGIVPMMNNLPNDTMLSDGTTFRGSVDAALARWNEVVGNVEFTGAHGPTGDYENGNGLNEIALDDTIAGYTFGANTLAVTLSFTDGGNYRVESDIIFNRKWTWDSYRGPLRSNDDDVRRVGLHELGHVLGLDHPDQATPPQAVAAIMNSVEGDTDALLQDDIDGAHYLYGAPDSPPPNDDFADAIELVLDANGSATATGSTVQSTAEAGEPVLDAYYQSGRSTWWKWTATRRTLVSVTTLGSRFDTMIGVFTGPAVNQLSLVGVNDDVNPGIVRTSSLTFLAEVNATYYFMVDGHQGFEGGVQVNLHTLDAPPPSVTIAQARVIAPLGKNLELSVSASPSIGGALSYQWRWNNRLIRGATTDRFTLEGVTNDEIGAYTVAVTETDGSTAYATTFVLPSYPANEVVTWRGPGSYGAAAVPEGLTDVIAVASGETHSLALKTDGTVVGWGGQSSVSFSLGQEIPPAGLTDVVALAAGSTHSLALKADGTVVAWGGESFYSPARVPAELRDVIAINAEGKVSSALLADGRVVAWSAGSTVLTPRTLPRDVVALDGNFTLHHDGQVRSWAQSFTSEVPIPRLVEVRKIGAAKRVLLALGEDGRVRELSDDGLREVAGADDTTDVVAGRYLLRSDGHIAVAETDNPNVVFGLGMPPADLDQVLQFDAVGVGLALRATAQVRPPVMVTPPASIAEMGTGETLTLAARVTGDGPFVFVWKRDGVVVTNGDFVTGAGSARLRIEHVAVSDGGAYTLEVSTSAGTVTSPVATVNVVPAVAFTQRPLSRIVLAGDNLVLVAKAAGHGTLRYQWSHGGQPIAGATSPSLSLTHMTLADAGRYELKVQDDRSSAWTQCFVRVGATTGAVVVWDGHIFGITYPAVAAPVMNKSVVQVDVSGHALALLADGEVRAWGSAYSGETTVPSGLSDVVDIAVGDKFSVALRGDGTVVAWGINNMGQCAVPAGLDEVVAIEAGYDYAVALRADGTLVKWGRAERWATMPPRLAGVADISVADVAGIALLRDGDVATWNVSGVTPTDLGPVIHIIGGDRQLAVTTASGAVRYWSVGTDSYTSNPSLAVLRDVSVLAQGPAGGLAVQGDGSFVSWDPDGNPLADTPAGVADVVGGAVGDYRAVIMRAAAPRILAVTAAEQEITASDELVLSVEVATPGSLDFTWFHDGERVVPGGGITVAANGTLRIAHTGNGDGGDYTVQVANAGGATTSNPFSVVVHSRPGPLVWPTHRTFLEGEAVSLDLTAAEPGVSYTWYRDGTRMSPQPGSILQRSGASIADVGCYHVIMSNAAGTRVDVGFSVDVVEPDSGLRVWGDNPYLDFDWPLTLSNVRQYAMGPHHLLVLMADGTVLGFGEDVQGETEVPSDLGPAVQVAADGDFSLALRPDGTVVQWGRPPWGQAVPADLPPIAAIAAGGGVGLALTVDGELFVWGYNHAHTSAPEDLPRVVQCEPTVSGGYLAVLEDGTVREYSGDTRSFITVPTALNSVAAVHAFSGYNRIAIARNGTGSYWQRGQNALLPIPVALPARILTASVSSYQNLLLLADRSVSGWAAQPIELLLPDAGARLSQITAQYRQTIGLTRSPAESLRWLQVPGNQVVQPAASFTLHAAAAGGVGELRYQWSRNGHDLVDGGEIAGATTANLSIAFASPLLDGTYAVRVSDDVATLSSVPATVETILKGPAPTLASRPRSRIVREGEGVAIPVEVSNATRYQWRRNRQVVLGQETSTLHFNAVTPADAGCYEFWAINHDGGAAHAVFYLTVAPSAVAVVEAHSYETLLYDVPEDVGDPASIVAESGINAVVRPDGTVRAWGDAAADTLAALNALTHVVSLSFTSAGGLALKDDGTLAGWGSAAGVPAKASAWTDIVALAVAGDWVVLLQANGTVRTLSLRSFGVGSPPAGLDEVVAINSSSVDCVAIRSDGSVVAWAGANGTVRNVPATVVDAVRVDMVKEYSVFQRSDGSLVEWYYGTSGRSRLAGATGPAKDFVVGNGTGVVGLDGLAKVYSTTVDERLLANFVGALDIAGGTSNWLALVPTQGPTIVNAPAAVTVASGAAATLSVSAIGDGELRYFWRFQGQVLMDDGRIVGSRTPSLTIADVSVADFGDYDVLVVDAKGVVRSDPVRLWLTSPVLQREPRHTLVLRGGDVTLDAGVALPPEYPATHQWYAGDTGDTSRPIAGGDAMALALSDVQSIGRYWLRVENAAGRVDTAVALVLPVEPVDIGFTTGSGTSVGFANGHYFVFSNEGSAVSTDGTAWAPVSRQVADARSLIYVNDAYYQAASDGVFRSSDGFDWNQQLQTANARSLAFGAGRFVLSTETGIFQSTDGVTWQAVISGYLPSVALYGPVGWLGGVRDASVLVSSTDGALWKYFGPIPGAMRDMMYVDNRYLAVVRRGGAYRSVVSTNTSDWTMSDRFEDLAAPDGIAYQLAGGNGVYMAAGGDRFAIGDETMHWSERSDSMHAITRVAFGQRRFLLSSATGTVYLSAPLPEPVSFAGLPGKTTVEWGSSLSLTAPDAGPNATYQWFNGQSGDMSDPVSAATSRTLAIAPTSSASFWVNINDGFRSQASPAVEVTVEIHPIVLASSPQSLTVAVGQASALSVSAHGTGPLHYQWYRNGTPLAAETGATLNLAAVAFSDAGRYEVAVSNALQSVRSAPAWISVLPQDSTLMATQAANSEHYVPGGEITLTGRLTLASGTGLTTWRVLLPAGWTLSSVAETSAAPTLAPDLGAADLLEWTWSDGGTSPLTLSFTVGIPEAQRGPVEFVTLANVQLGGESVLVLAQPDPLRLYPPFHSADVDGDQRLSLPELLRVIGLYNTRFGSVRTGRYRVSDTTADGFDPDPRDPDILAGNSRFHSADTDHDGSLSLAELLRVIQLYNTRRGTVRTGAYRFDAQGVDGFAPGE